MMKGAHLVEVVGKALYAHRWQTSLARDLGVSDRLVRFWAAGDRDLPTSMLPNLLQLLRSRSEALEDATKLVESYIDKAK